MGASLPQHTCDDGCRYDQDIITINNTVPRWPQAARAFGHSCQTALVLPHWRLPRGNARRRWWWRFTLIRACRPRASYLLTPCGRCLISKSPSASSLHRIIIISIVALLQTLLCGSPALIWPDHHFLCCSRICWEQARSFLCCIMDEDINMKH